MTRFTGEEFLKALESEQGIPIPQLAIKLIGMAKPLAANQSDAFLFSPGGSCAIWIPIPVYLVEQVDHLSKVPCGDHQHDLVRVHFKSVRQPEAAVFAQLLQAQAGSAKSELSMAYPGMDESGIDTFEGMTIAPTMTMERGWRPPWTWSRCAKCKLEVNAFITGTVMVACAAAGTTGPGAIAVAQALIAGAYGAAAWEAVKAVIFSASVDELSRKICASQGKC